VEVSNSGNVLPTRLDVSPFKFDAFTLKLKGMMAVDVIRIMLLLYVFYIAIVKLVINFES
jgi:hypothetical protein